MPRTAPPEADDLDTPDPVGRSRPEIAGDIRDRLATLVNTTQVIRLLSADGDPDLLSGLRRIEEQVRCLGRLADELCRGRDAHPVPANGHGKSHRPAPAATPECHPQPARAAPCQGR